MKMNKVYTSFAEVDQDLMLLKLQADICKEEISIATKRVQNSLHPAELTRNFFYLYATNPNE